MSKTRTETAKARCDEPDERPAIRCRGLIKRYPDVVAVDGIDLTIARGESFGLLGPNGAGKTTTVEILEGLTAADGGEVEVLGCSWGGGRDRQLRERLGIQLQETQLAEKLTVRETIRLFRSFYRRGRSVDEVVAMLELADKADSRVGKLSGGQKQRLALACTLVGDPEMLFLDEPTTGLDPQARLKLWEVVEDFHRSGGTVVLTTHYMEEADRLCERVAIIDNGKIIALGAPAELVRGLGADQVIEFSLSCEAAESELASLPGVTSASRRNGDYLITVSKVDETLPALFAYLERSGAALVNLSTHRATLEDVFISYTGRALRDA